MVQIIRNPSGFAGYSVNPNTGTFTAPFMGFTNQRIPLPKNAIVQNKGRSALDNIYGMSTNRSVAASPPSVVAFNNAMNQGLLNRRTPTKSSGMFVDPATDNPLLRNFPVIDILFLDNSSTVPCATTVPPPSPPSGPRSITQSAHLTTSKLCSITIIVLP